MSESLPQREIILIDLSSIAYPIWHTSQSDPDPNKTSQQTVARVRALATGHPHVAVCCDAGRSFRKEITATYKATRPEHDASMQHQITLAREQLEADGFPVWAVPSFEADDLIAAATAWALRGTAGETVLIVSADKDMLQLVGPRVRAMNPVNGAILDVEGVFAKLGVRPEQIRDYLTLVGDKSDNVIGADKIGEKTAAKLLCQFSTLDALYEQLEARGGGALGIQPSISASLRQFKATGAMELARLLVTLRTDVDLPFDRVFAERVSKDAESFGQFNVDDDDTDEREGFDAVMHAASAPQDTLKPTAERESGVAVSDGRSMPTRVDAAEGVAPPPRGADSVSGNGAGTVALSASRPVSSGIAVREPDIMPSPAEWERGLDPRSMRDARILALDMFKSRMFSAYGTAEGVLSTIMVGRELGLPAMASLRSVHIIEGKHSLSASLMVALILKSGLAAYFKPVKFSDIEATFTTLRKGDGNDPVTLTHTIEMARLAWPKTKPDWEKSFLASGWGRNPTDMLVARSTSRLARMIYADLLAGLYTPEELIELREAGIAA